MTEKNTRDLIDEETTRSLMEVLMNTDNVDKYLKDNKDSLNPYMTFIEYYQSLPKVKSMKLSEIKNASNINKNYFYPLIRGTKNSPNRDYVIALCIAAKLDIDETQKGLKIAKLGELYSRDSRDAIIIFCINHNKTVIETDEMLEERGEEIISKDKD